MELKTTCTSSCSLRDRWYLAYIDRLYNASRKCSVSFVDGLVWSFFVRAVKYCSERERAADNIHLDRRYSSIHSTWHTVTKDARSLATWVGFWSSVASSRSWFHEALIQLSQNPKAKVWKEINGTSSSCLC